MPHLERYWQDADPDYCDGEEAESFATLLRRCEAALDRLAAMPADRWSMCSGMGSSSRPRVRSSPTPIWTKGQDAGVLAQGRAARDQQRAAVGFHWQGGRWECAGVAA
jgi:hypothetical protein